MLAWWRTNTSTAMVNDSLTTPKSSRTNAAQGAEAKAASAASDERRAMAATSSHTAQAARPIGQDAGDQDPKARGNALAAFEPQPDRKQMAQNRGEAGQQGGILIIQPGPCDQDGRRALQPVQHQGGGGEALPPGPQNVGRADIAGPDARGYLPNRRVLVSSRPNGMEPSR